MQQVNPDSSFSEDSKSVILSTNTYFCHVHFLLLQHQEHECQVKPQRNLKVRELGLNIKHIAHEQSKTRMLSVAHLFVIEKSLLKTPVVLVVKQ